MVSSAHSLAAASAGVSLSRWLLRNEKQKMQVRNAAAYFLTQNQKQLRMEMKWPPKYVSHPNQDILEIV